MHVAVTQRSRMSAQTVKALSQECDELRRSAQSMREQLERNLITLQQSQQTAEEGLRAAFKMNAEDTQLEVKRKWRALVCVFLSPSLPPSLPPSRSRCGPRFIPLSLGQ